MSVQALVEQIKQCEQKGDLMGIVRLRAQIARDFPATPEAAEALFRMGLYFLFVENQIPSAMQTFEEAIKTKDPQWSKAARVSLASLYLREGKPQKALLELRKAIGEKEPSTIHVISALSIMESILEEQGDLNAAKQTKRDKVRHLAILADEARKAGDDGVLAFYMVSLGQEQVQLGEIFSAKTLLEEVIAMGAPRAGQSALNQAQTLLKSLG